MKYVAKELKETADASKGHADWPTAAKNFLSVMIVFGLIYLALGLIADLTAAYIPDDLESKISTTYEGSFFSSPDKKHKLHKQFSRANRLLSELVAMGGLRSMPYKLVLVETDAPNAFAFPGGPIGVTTGLLNLIKTDAGMAMVLGHELGHHQQRHALKRLGRGLLYGIAMAIIFQDISSNLIQSVFGMAEMGHSRDQELEADLIGLKLNQQKYGTQKIPDALEFFEAMKLKDAPSKGNKWGSMFRTHPYPDERIKELNRLMDQ